jgi:hypothetical protein
VRALCDAFNGRDPTAAEPWLNPDVEMHDYPGFPDQEVHYGYDGMRAWAAKLLRAGDVRIEPSDLTGWQSVLLRVAH